MDKGIEALIADYQQRIMRNCDDAGGVLVGALGLQYILTALEQAHQENKEQSARIGELESQRELAFMACNRWRDKCVDAEKRIAELESRPLCVKLPEAFYPDGDIEVPLVVNLDDVIESIRVAGGTTEGSEQNV